MKGQIANPSIDITTANEANELEARIQCRLGGQIRAFRLVVEREG